MPVQNILLFAFGANYDEICLGSVCKIIYRDQFAFVLCFPAGGKGDVLCPAIRVGAIEGREAMPLCFRDSFFQFFLIPSVSIPVICAFHNALDLQLVRNDVRVGFCIRIAGTKNVLFVLLVKAELF